MKPVPLKNKDEIFEEVVKQLRRLIMSDQYTVEWLENESRQETEYPIQELAVQAGYQTTKEFLHEEFYDYVEFVDSQSIRAGPDLYDFNDEVMKDCLSLHARTVPKIRRGRGGNYGGGGGGRAGIPDYRNSQPSSSRAPLNRQQQPSNYSSMNFRQRSPPFIRNRSSPSPPIQTPFTRKRSPLSVIPPNFVEQSSLIHCSSSNIMAGPPPGFENPEKSHRQINIDSTEAYDNIQASSVYPPSSVSDDDPFDVKTVKIINGASCNNSSPDHRPPPDPKNARFEEAEKKLQTFIPSPPGYSIPQEPAVKTLASNKYESFEDEEEFFDALDDPQLMKLPACLSFKEPEKREYETPLQIQDDIKVIFPKSYEMPSDKSESFDAESDIKATVPKSYEMPSEKSESFDAKSDIKATVPKSYEMPSEKSESFDAESGYLNYFVDTITAIHYNIPNKNRALLNDVVQKLPVKVSFQPGFDVLSLFTVIKALGPSFINVTEEYNVEDGTLLIYVKNVNRGMKKDEYRTILRSTLSFLMPNLSIPLIVNGVKLTKAIIYEAKNGQYPYFVKVSSTKGEEKKLEEILRKTETFELENPYPFALCVYFHNNRIPYRAQIIAQIDSTNINIELVDVGEFLTVTIDQLKYVQSDELSKLPRFTIPCRIEDEIKPNLRKTYDGFQRKSTCKSVPMYLTQENNKKYVSIKLF